MTPIDTVDTVDHADTDSADTDSADTGSLTESLLLSACDEEIAIARAIAASTAKNHRTYGERNEDVMDSAYSRPGFACTGRQILEVVVGDGIHADGASTDVRIKYDGWATVAEAAGHTELAAALRRYVAEHRRAAGGLLVSEAIAYLDDVRRLIAAA